MLARILGLQAAKVERGLMLFLAVLVEIGAALGLYFATGHMRPAGSGYARRGRGATMIEGEALKDVPERELRAAPVKQIASSGSTARAAPEPDLAEAFNKTNEARKEKPWAMWCPS